MDFLVCHGLYQRTYDEFDSFEAALACYREHRGELFRAAIYGPGHDYDCDGLTDEQRELVEAA